MKDKTYAKGVVMGILVGIAIPLVVLCTMMFFNIGNVGNFLRTVKILDNYSLEPLSLSQKAEGAITGMVDQLGDPYSYYLDKDEYADLMTEVSGSYEGLGIYLATEEGADYTIVMAPIKGSPAFDAGLLAGDEIVKINGEDMAGVSADQIATKIKTGEETHFVLEVRRKGEMLTFELARTKIDIPSVDGQFLEGQDGIAYISISSFAENTPTELKDVISGLEQEGEIKGILLDLRNNPGGSVSAVLQVADMFLTQGDHILWVEEKDDETCYDAENTNPYSYPVVMLVNENSASASEILSGAMQDNKRATIVGTTTFGKGIIQTVYALSDGAAVKVTTAEYLSPDKNKIHKVGVKPDVEVELGSDDISIIYSLDMSLDPQLAEANKILQEKIK